MAWHPNDLVTDVDLTAYENAVLTQFGVAGWETKRTKALDDWLGPILRTQGFQIERLRTRNEVDLAYGYTGGVYTDATSAARSTTVEDINLATTFATVGTDALYIGSKQQFRGLSVRMHEGVSAVAAVTTVAYWGDSWTALAIADGTAKTSGKAFSGGGSITWAVPSMWVKRSIGGSDPLYWAKVTISATPTAATTGQIGVIRRSALCAPAALRTLTLIMREAPTSGGGPWDAKADYYEKEADAALQRALLIIGGEFESDDPPTDQISEEESEQTVAEVNGGGWRMERA
jgi:hypothetical protein